MLFCDWLTITQKHRAAKPLAGLRLLSYREAGDIDRQGEVVEKQAAVDDRVLWAWVRGSHDTKIRLLSHEGLVALSGNPGRFERPDNIFNLDFAATVDRAGEIAQSEGLPRFTPGEVVGCGELMTEVKWSGARVWCVHLTQNYRTGSPENARAVIDWLDRQSVARVKKSRLGASTVVWGSLGYCQTEAYIKADEMLAHAKGDDEKKAVQESPAYNWAKANGIVRVEVKAAKDYLRYKGLTYLGEWTMEKVKSIFEERTEVLHRCRVDVEDFDLNLVPARYRMTCAAWLRGENVAHLFASRTTLWRHAKALREIGIDITERRNIETMPVRIRTINLEPVAPPSWYRLAA